MEQNSPPNKRKEAELKRLLQTSNLELKLEVRVKGLNPHPVFRISKIVHKTPPAPFHNTHIEFEQDQLPQLPDLTYGKIVF